VENHYIQIANESPSPFIHPLRFRFAGSAAGYAQFQHTERPAQ
jgi:hypothetical protein